MPKPGSDHLLFKHECTGDYRLHKKLQYSASAPSMKAFDKSYNAGYHVQPKYTMRPKVAFGAMRIQSTSSDTAGPLDISAAKYKPPVYSMRARTCKMLQMPGMTMDAVPGPGAYPIPSTTYLDHPCLSMPRRCSFGCAARF